MFKLRCSVCRIIGPNISPKFLLFRPRFKAGNFSSKSEITPSQPSSEQLPSTSIRTVKETVKDVGYGGVIVGGLILTGCIFYMVFNELFSKKSANGVYNAALKLCVNDVRVQDLLGSNIKARVEMNRRGRGRHVANQLWYDSEKRLHMAMKFYLQGTLGSGVVHLEVCENDQKDFEYRFLVVESEGGFTKKHVVIYPPESPANLVPSLG